MDIGIALVLLFCVTDTSIKMTNDRNDLYDRSWEAIKKQLSS